VLILFVGHLGRATCTVQLDKYDTAANFYSIKPKLDMRLFVDFCIFTCFYHFFHDVIIKLFCRSKQKNR
jgi:hypothetical protein